MRKEYTYFVIITVTLEIIASIFHETTLVFILLWILFAGNLVISLKDYFLMSERINDSKDNLDKFENVVEKYLKFVYTLIENECMIIEIDSINYIITAKKVEVTDNEVYKMW